MENLLTALRAEVQNFLYQEDHFIAKLVSKLEQMTEIDRENIVYGFLSAIVIYLVLGHGAELLCNTIGYAYPAYASFKAIETEDKTDDTQWLTYWAVFGATSLVDFASDKIMGVFPIYWLAKCVFLLWLYLPMFHGAQQLHEKLFGPMFKRFRLAIQGNAVEQEGVVAEQDVMIDRGVDQNQEMETEQDVPAVDENEPADPYL